MSNFQVGDYVRSLVGMPDADGKQPEGVILQIEPDQGDEYVNVIRWNNGAFSGDVTNEADRDLEKLSYLNDDNPPPSRDASEDAYYAQEPTLQHKQVEHDLLDGGTPKDIAGAVADDADNEPGQLVAYKGQIYELIGKNEKAITATLFRNGEFFEDVDLDMISAVVAVNDVKVKAEAGLNVGDRVRWVDGDYPEMNGLEGTVVGKDDDGAYLDSGTPNAQHGSLYVDFGDDGNLLANGVGMDLTEDGAALVLPSQVQKVGFKTSSNDGLDEGDWVEYLGDDYNEGGLGYICGTNVEGYHDVVVVQFESGQRADLNKAYLMARPDLPNKYTGRTRNSSKTAGEDSVAGFSVGDRVRDTDEDLEGTVYSIMGDCVHVEFDDGGTQEYFSPDAQRYLVKTAGYGDETASNAACPQCGSDSGDCDCVSNVMGMSLEDTYKTASKMAERIDPDLTAKAMWNNLDNWYVAGHRGKIVAWIDQHRDELRSTAAEFQKGDRVKDARNGDLGTVFDWEDSPSGCFYQVKWDAYDGLPDNQWYSENELTQASE